MGRNRIPVAAMSLAKMLRILRDVGGTTAELAEAVGITHKTMANYVKFLRREKLIYIKGYSVDALGRSHWRCKIWAWGNCHDASFPRVTAEHVRNRKRHAQRARMRLAKQLGVLRTTDSQQAAQ